MFCLVFNQLSGLQSTADQEFHCQLKSITLRPNGPNRTSDTGRPFSVHKKRNKVGPIRELDNKQQLTVTS